MMACKWDSCTCGGEGVNTFVTLSIRMYVNLPFLLLYFALFIVIFALKSFKNIYLKSTFVPLKGLNVGFPT